jgi:predicted enzyme related to lactoylglutathione lyase
MNPVVHFEMSGEDTQRMANFYASAFGWKHQVLGAEMGNYVTVSTTETGEDGMPKIPGAINGGFYLRQDGAPTAPSVVIAVDNINDSIYKVIEAGGKIEGEPMMIPGVGMWVGFTDTEGNRASMLQPLMEEK